MEDNCAEEEDVAEDDAAVPMDSRRIRAVLRCSAGISLASHAKEETSTEKSIRSRNLKEREHCKPRGKKLGRSICAGLEFAARDFFGGVETDSASAFRGQEMLIADIRSRPSSSKNRLRGVEIESIRVAGQIAEKHKLTLEVDR